MELETSLKRFFGYNAFREHQKEIVTALLEGKDVMAILPTGAGKSICYQLPALLMPGISVVISPLISLMQDQVVSLSKNGIPAAFLNSSLGYAEIQSTYQHLNQYKLLYVAPERFADPNFLSILQQSQVSLFAIDEAHCISQWGHSFRPDYRQLSLLKKHFPSSPVVALTATATRDVEEDIVQQLGIQASYRIRASFDRPNLTFHVHAKSDPFNQLRSFLNKHAGESGIIYAATRKTVDETYEQLKNAGYIVGKYHAGLSDTERMVTQHAFVHGELPLIVASVAFGMGIHKPDIRFIVHLDMPRSLEQYYQEVGRAGRDGLPAECLMLFSAKERIVYDFFLEQITDEIVKKTTQAKTARMSAFCHASLCRRKELLRYFGETYPLSSCNGCDNCLDNTELSDETLAAQKILSCIYRLNEGFGMKHVIDVLRGAQTEIIQKRGHDTLSTYGLLRDYSAEDLRYYIETLLARGFIKRSEDAYPVLQLTQTASQLLKGTSPFSIRKKIRKIAQRKGSLLPEYDKTLFGELSSLRRALAQKSNVPAFVILGDRSLIEMSIAYPRTREALLKINGFGPIKLEKYGQDFLAIIDHYCTQKNITPQPEQVPPVQETPKEKALTREASSQETARLFAQGLSLALIANQRKLTTHTLLSHLEEQIASGTDLDITPLVSAEKQKAIHAVIAALGVEKLAPLKGSLPEDFTYDEIRLVAAFHRRVSTDTPI